MDVTPIYLLFLLVSSALAAPSYQTQDEFWNLLVFGDQSTRIVGGTPAPEEKDPHMVVLTRGVFINNLLCGGSLITQRTVLTAAHCIAPVTGNFQGPISATLQGTAGTKRLDHGLGGGITFRFSGYVAHSEYNSNTIKNDIGLLYTRWNVATSDRVSPVALTFDFIGGNEPVRAAGFGRIIRGGAISQVLLELEMATIDGAECVRVVPIAAAENGWESIPPVDPEVEICTFHSAGHGMCNGDSGSALTRQNTGEQIGIVSWGIPCALGGPDMFVRVSAFQSWLEERII